MKLLLGLNEAEQGWLLFSGPIGNLVSFTFASALVTRIGSRRSLLLATCVYFASALGIAACFICRAPVPLWCVAIASLGGTGNLFNISVNTQGGIVERKAGRTIMNSFHAMFSVMCLVAGLLALVASNVGLPPGWRLMGVLAVAVVAHLVFLPSLPKDNDVAKKAKGEGMRRPDMALFLLGLAALVIMGCEGSINDWVGVFYRDALSAPDGRVKWGFCAVAATMTIGRLVTDGFINRFGDVKVLRAHCVLVAAGLGIALSSPYTGLSGLPLHILATTGYAVAGYGISALAPILYSKANRAKSMPAASAVTFVGSMGFLGYFMGPPMIGHVAHATSLSISLGIFAVLILACLFLRLEDDRG
jgi:MFS family permease